jgi:hypothetical protein
MGLFTNNRTGSSVDELKYNFDQGARGNRFDVNFFLPGTFGYKQRTNAGQSVTDSAFDGTDKATHGGKEIREIVVTGKNKKGWTGTTDSRVMGLRVESCTLPGREIETTRFSEYGAERTMPIGTVDDGGTIDFTFICDQSFADRLIIEAWQSMVYSGGIMSAGGTITEDMIADGGEDGNAKVGDSYEGEHFGGTIEMPKLGWYDDYIGRVQIIQHRTDRKGSEDTKRNALEYTLHEAYPVSFDEQTLGMEETGIMKFKCTIAYRFWESKYIPAPKRSLLNRGRGLLDALLGGSNLLSRFGKEGKLRNKLTNLDNRATEIKNLFG